jgi:hypothetical protein
MIEGYEGRVAVVRWIDPHSVDEWTTIEEIDQTPCVVESIGILLKENDSVIVLTLNKSDDTASCTMIIPKRCIIYLTVLDQNINELGEFPPDDAS